jgi:hypothetical protein
MFYKQCKFRKDNVVAYSWIPEKLAHKGKIVRFKVDDIWFDGYRIEEVYDSRKEEIDAIEDSQAYKHQREASDI